MLCKDIMKKNVKFCAPDDPVHQVAEMMRDENIGFVPICDDARRVLGTLTDRDIVVRVVAARLSEDSNCGQVMTKNVITCRQDASLAVAMQMMSKHQISRIICVDGQDMMVGVISLSDLAQQEDERRVARTLRNVSHREATLH